jgi:CHAT domain-containing protein
MVDEDDDRREAVRRAQGLILGLFRVESSEDFWQYIADHPEIHAEPVLSVLLRVVASMPADASFDECRRMAAGVRRCSRYGQARARADWMTGTDYLTPDELDELLETTRAAQHRFSETSNRAAADEAIAGLAAMIDHPAAAGVLHDFRLGLMNDQGLLLMHRYLYGKPSAEAELGDLTRAVEVWSRAVAESPSGWTGTATYQANIGTACGLHYEKSADETVRTQGMAALSAACLADEVGSPTMANRTQALGRLGRLGYFASHNRQRLDELIDVLVRLPGAATGDETAGPATTPSNYDVQEQLGVALLLRFEHSTEASDAEWAVRVWQAAAASSGSLYDQGNHSLALRSRYEANRDMADLDEAIAVGTAVRDQLAPDDPELPAGLHNLGTCMLHRYAATSADADLAAAIAALQGSVDLSTDPARLPRRLNALAGALGERYELTGELADLARASELAAKAAHLEPDTSPEYLRSLVLQARFLIAGHEFGSGLADLERAFELTGQVLRSGAQWSANAHDALVNRCIAAMSLAGYPGREYRLIDALNASERIYVNSRPGSVQRRKAAISYAACLLLVDVGNRRDLDLAVQILLEAETDAAAAGTPDPAVRDMSTLAIIRRYQLFEDMGDFVAAQERLAGVEEAADSGEQRVHALSSLGQLTYLRYRHTSDTAALDQAIDALQAAANQVPEPVDLQLMTTLAEARRDRYRITEQPDDLTLGVAAYRACVEAAGDSSPQARLRAAHGWSEWAAERGKWEEAVEACRHSATIAEQMVRTYAGGPDLDRSLAVSQEIAATAAIGLVHLGHPEEAATALEAARAVILTEALELSRADLESLHRAGHADLANRYAEMLDRQAALESADQDPLLDHLATLSNRAFPTRSEHLAALRVNRANLVEIAAQMRQLEGHEDFLLPPSFADLVSAASRRPLVYVTTARAGGVAIVVRPDGSTVQHIIESLNSAAVRVHTARLARAVGSRALATTRQADVDDTTRWLWDNLMGHLMPQLASSGAATFIVGGLLGSLPLHAAWTVEAGEREVRRYVLNDLVVHYAPSARSLREQPSEQDRPTGMLAVQEPAPVSADPLPGAAGEVAAALAHFTTGTTLRGQEATVAAVLDAWTRWPVLHFACHGRIDPQNPRNSRLLLAFDAPITLADIARASLHQVRIVSLSACETAISGAEVPDELLSLSAGFVQAGAVGVVGSLWRVSDVETALLFGRFYQLWLAERLAPAEALRAAQLWLRDATNGEKASLFPQIYPVRSSSALWRDARVHGDPVHWAGFVFTGN